MAGKAVMAQASVVSNVKAIEKESLLHRKRYWWYYVLALICWELVRWVLSGCSPLFYLLLVCVGVLAVQRYRQRAAMSNKPSDGGFQDLETSGAPEEAEALMALVTIPSRVMRALTLTLS